jgi:predicted Zn-dependent peptidase
VKDIEEEMEVEQGKLTLGFRTNISYDSYDYEASVLFTTILGGGANSKLFNEIREEKSLSYYIYAKLEKHKSILLITAGINSKDKDQVVTLIKGNINKIQNGEITKEELSIAKKSIISSLESKSDYPNSFINYYYNQLLGNQVIDIEKLIKKYQAVTIEEIISVSEVIELDTIHFIKGKEQVTANEN